MWIMSDDATANLIPLMTCWAADKLQIAVTVSAASKNFALAMGVGIARLRACMCLSVSVLTSGRSMPKSLNESCHKLRCSKCCSRESSSWQTFAQGSVLQAQLSRVYGL